MTTPMFKFDLQLFGGGGGKGGGGGGGSSSSQYVPSAQELQIMNYMAQNAGNAQTGIKSMLEQLNTGVQSDAFKSLLSNSLNQIQSGQNLTSQLTQGQLPTAYTDNMTNAIKTGVDNTVGSAINSLGNRGVLNSSVTNKAMNDIEKNVSDTMAQQYSNNIGQLAGLANQQIGTATAGYNPYNTLAGLIQGQENTFINSPVGALRGSGTTNSKSNDGSSFGSNLLNAGLGLATGWAGKQMGLGFL